jgi:hypothetical protein
MIAAPELVPRVATPERLPADLLSHARPLVLTDLCAGWPAIGRWTFDRLRDQHGETPVTIVRVEDGAVVMDPRRGLLSRTGALGDFVRELQAGGSPGYVMTDLGGLPDALAREAPLPALGAAALWRTTRLWISAAGTISALHFDVAHNLHTVVAGRKRFTLFSWTQSHNLYPRGPLASMPNASRVDLEAPDYQRFPRLRLARPMVADVGPGDTLFMPGGWWHHVRTVDHTIAVNAFFATGVRGAALVGVNLYKRLRGLSR